MTKRAICTILAAFLLVGCTSEEPEPIDETVTITSEIADLSEYGLESSEYIQKITPRAFLQFINEGGSGAFFLSTSSCEYCIIAMNLLVQAAEDCGVTVYYIDVEDSYYPFIEFSEEIVAFLDSVLVHTDEEVAQLYLPHLFTVKSGEVSKSHIGLMSYGYNGSSDDTRIIKRYTNILSK